MKRSRSLQTFYSGLGRAVLVLIALAIGRAILVRIPMLQELWIMEISMSGTDIASLTISLVMIGVLLNLGSVLRHGLPILVPRFPEGGTLAASIVHLVAIIVTYRTLLPLVTLLLKQEDLWIYRLVFLLFACYPLWRGGLACYRGIDAMTEFFASRIGVASGEAIECPQCGAVNEAEAQFCAQCGSELAGLKQHADEEIVCMYCETANPAGARYCTNCGKQLPRGQ